MNPKEHVVDLERGQDGECARLHRRETGIMTVLLSVLTHIGLSHLPSSIVSDPEGWVVEMQQERKDYWDPTTHKFMSLRDVLTYVDPIKGKYCESMEEFYFLQKSTA